MDKDKPSPPPPPLDTDPGKLTKGDKGGEKRG